MWGGSRGGWFAARFEGLLLGEAQHCETEAEEKGAEVRWRRVRIVGECALQRWMHRAHRRGGGGEKRINEHSSSGSWRPQRSRSRRQRREHRDQPARIIRSTTANE